MNERERERALSAAVGSATEAMTLDDIAREPIGALARMLDASVAFFGRYTPAELVAVGGNGAEFLAEYKRERVALDDPYYVASRRLSRPIMIASRMVAPRALHATRAFNDFFAPRGLHDSVFVMINDVKMGVPGSFGFRFFNGARAQRFGASDVRLIRRALPAFRAAARRSSRFEGIMRREAILDALVAEAGHLRAVIVLSLEGRPAWISPRGEALLGRELGGGRALPQALVSAARSLRDFALTGDLEAAAPQLSARFAIAGGRVIGCDLRLARARDGSGEPFIVVDLEDVRVDAAVDLVIARLRVRRGEARVLVLVARGLTNQEIAERLDLSAATVRTHLQNAFATLGVSSRMQAALLVQGALQRL